MVFLYILGTVYAIVGFVYALYILFNGIDAWYWFTINFALGPVTLLYNYYKFVIKRKLPKNV